MKRLLASVGIAAVLAFGLVFGRGASPLGAVGACSWSIENTASASQAFNSPAATFLDVSIVTWHDDCSHKQYESLVSVRNHASASYVVYLRVWVCNGIREQGSQTGTVRWSAVYTVTFPCGRQADNGPSGSSASSSAFSPNPVRKYVNQG